MIETLKTLCTLSGVSSREDQVRDYIRRRVEPCADSVRTDSLGNLIVFKRGAKSAGNRLMLCAHMDEVGLIVKSVTEEGYLKFGCVGGVDRRVLLGKRVTVGERELPGVIGLKAIHLTSQEERKKVPKLTDLYIDIGAKSKDEAQELVELGDVCTFVSDTVELGTRGAFGAAFSVTPEIALVLEGTTAADLPALEPERQVCWAGKGPVLSWMDGGTIYDRELFELLRSLAEKNNLPWQMKHYVSGGTDGKAVQRTKSGVRVAGISAAVRYLHAPSSVCSISDAEQMLDLARLFVQAMAER